MLIYKENSTNCYFSIYLLGWETLVNSYFLIKKYLQSFRKMRFCAVFLLGCRFVCLYSAKFDNHVLTFSVYFVLMYILFLCYSVFSNTLSTRKPFHSSTHLCSSVTFSFIRSNSFTCQPCSLVHSLVSFCYLVFYYKQLVHLSNSSTRPLPSIQATCQLVHLAHLSTHITTYIFLAIGFFVLYLCIVIRNEGMTNGVLRNQIIYNN